MKHFWKSRKKCSASSLWRNDAGFFHPFSLEDEVAETMEIIWEITIVSIDVCVVKFNAFSVMSFSISRRWQTRRIHFAF